MSSFITSQTRSHLGASYAVLAPESHVPAAVAGWAHTQVTILIAPRMSARFAEYLVGMQPGATSALPPAGVERFIYVLKGELAAHVDGVTSALAPGGYAFFPADTAHQITAASEARAVIIEKTYSPVAHGALPHTVIGHERDVPPKPIGGDETLRVKVLLPDAPGWDMAMNIMAFEPGAALGLVEVHVMEHGLLMLDGNLIYRLNENYHPVQAGDAIYMAPFCPQWCACFGKSPARYLLYKNWNRDPFGYGEGA